jgi:hypothetical protein
VKSKNFPFFDGLHAAAIWGAAYWTVVNSSPVFSAPILSASTNRHGTDASVATAFAPTGYDE